MSTAVETPASQRFALTSFRRDVEGLRALAVALVVLYHFHLGPFRGGYVGVDVFFVISGFVITSMLLRERSDSGRTSLSHFYARRARRILPAATTTIVVTVLATWWMLGASQGIATAHDGIAASLFYANVHFANAGSNYLTSGQAPSTLVHFWSLSIEEQFYFVWPGLFILLCLGAARANLRRLLMALIVIMIATFTFSIVATSSNGSATYYSSVARAGELALGALVAILTLRRSAAGRRASLPWLGDLALVSVVVSAIVLSDASRFPGWLVLWPTVSTAFVIYFARHSICTTVLTHRSVVWVGALSYSLYLWHWPIYALAAGRLGHEPALVWRLALLLLAVLVAWLCHRFIENPVRYSVALRGRWHLSLAVGAALVGTSVVVSLLVVGVAGNAQASTASPPAQNQRALDRAIGQSAQQHTTGTLVVPLAHLSSDIPSAGFDRGCLVSFSATTPMGSRPSDCTFGDVSARNVIVLFGDSTADQWIAALDAIGREQHVRVIELTRASCQLADLDLWNPAAHAPGRACTAFRHDALAMIATLHPMATIMTDYEYGLRWNYQNQPVDAATSASGLSRTIAQVARVSGSTVFLSMPPAVMSDPATCLSVHAGNIQTCQSPPACLSASNWSTSACTFDPATGRTWANVALLPGAVRAGGASYLDVTTLFCSSDACPPVTARTVVNYDLRHVAMSYTVYVHRVLSGMLVHLIAGLGS